MARRRRRLRWSRDRSRNETWNQLVLKAVDEISHMNGQARGFVKVATIKRRKSLDATEKQTDLYRWIQDRGFVPFEITLGMHFGQLGGLKARRLVVDVVENGTPGVRAV